VHPVVVSLTAAALGFAPASHASHLHRAAAPAKSAAGTASARLHLSALESGLLGQINAVRARRGLRPFRLSAGLTAAATQHSQSMADKGYFSHDSANGTSFWRRIASFYGYRGFRNWSVGENILWSSPDIEAAGALRMWMESPEHRANLLDRNWREIGLAAVHAANAPGVYGGDEVTVVTADFGLRG
jgi:uncharacterized protein YkwD